MDPRFVVVVDDEGGRTDTRTHARTSVLVRKLDVEHLPLPVIPLRLSH